MTEELVEAITVLLPGAALNWTLALTACVGVSWSFGLLHRREKLQG